MDDAGYTILTCPDCDKKFESQKSLRVHIAQHKWGPHKIVSSPTGTKFQCLHPGCNKVVSDRKVLRKHLLTHRPRQFVCHYQDCNKRFYERAKLKRHFLVHTGEKQFICPFDDCGKEFAYKANLKTHIRTHTGHRPFSCTFPGCDKKFAQASNRNSHLQTHSKRRRLGADKKVDVELANLAFPHPDTGNDDSSNKQAKTSIESIKGKKPKKAISPTSRDTMASLLMLGNNEEKGQHGTNTKTHEVQGCKNEKQEQQETNQASNMVSMLTPPVVQTVVPVAMPGMSFWPVGGQLFLAPQMLSNIGLTGTNLYTVLPQMQPPFPVSSQSSSSLTPVALSHKSTVHLDEVGVDSKNKEKKLGAPSS